MYTFMENVATSDYYGSSKANICEPQIIDPRVLLAINLTTFETNDTLSSPSFFSQTGPQPLAFNNEAFQSSNFNSPPPNTQVCTMPLPTSLTRRIPILFNVVLGTYTKSS